MNRRFLRALATITVLGATVAYFLYYFASHPTTRHQLASVSPGSVMLLLVLYLLFIISLAAINSATLRLCRLSISNRESLLLTMYSSIVNFFGPLQSGPALRAVYLKKKYNLKLTQYTAATIVYYLFFAGFSGLFLLSGVLGWWIVVPALLGCAVLYGLQTVQHPRLKRLQQLDMAGWYLLGLATLAQVSLVAVIYYTELRIVAPAVRAGQALVYTGAANFALFVSLTPGAIGFRESFLVFSEKLHHITGNVIVLANSIDRAVYIILLLILAVGIFGSHASKRFTDQSTKR